MYNSTVSVVNVTDMVHRDLKLENILLSTEDPSKQFNIKVRSPLREVYHYFYMFCIVKIIKLMFCDFWCGHLLVGNL